MKSAIVLFNTSFVGSSAGETFLWPGGRSAICITATSYGGAVFLQFQAGGGKWFNVNGTTYSADQITGYDLPAGQVKLVSQSSSVNVHASLSPIPYGG